MSGIAATCVIQPLDIVKVRELPQINSARVLGTQTLLFRTGPIPLAAPTIERRSAHSLGG